MSDFLKSKGWQFNSPPTTSFELNKQSPQARGLVGWWPSNPATAGGNILPDMSGYRADGAFGGGASWAISNQGNVLSFDGVDGVVSIDSELLRLTGNQSMSMWVYPTASLSSGDTLIRRDNDGGSGGWGFSIFSNYSGDGQRWQAQVIATSPGTLQISSPTPSVNTSINTLTHVLATWVDGVGLSLFVNGVFIGRTDSAYTTLRTSDQSHTLGAKVGGASPFEGYLSDVRIYKRALTPTEVWELYNPATRWDLYKPLFDPFVGVIAGTAPAANTRRYTLPIMGVG